MSLARSGGVAGLRAVGTKRVISEFAGRFGVGLWPNYAVRRGGRKRCE